MNKYTVFKNSAIKNYLKKIMVTLKRSNYF